MRSVLLTNLGPVYRSDVIFDLTKMQPYTLLDLLEPFQSRAHDVVLYLPRNSDMRQLANQAEGSGKITVIHYCMEGASKVTGYPCSCISGLIVLQAICAYFGNFVFR